MAKLTTMSWRKSKLDLESMNTYSLSSTAATDLTVISPEGEIVFHGFT